MTSSLILDCESQMDSGVEGHLGYGLAMDLLAGIIWDVD